MEKFWFALAQTHLPPPTPESMRVGRPTGPPTLGHIFTSLRRLSDDVPVNAGAVEPFPAGTDIHSPNRIIGFE